MTARWRARLIVVCVCCGFAAKASAFHEGGTASCSGCHIMHGSDPTRLSNTKEPGNEYLLRYPTATDVCLSCHATGFGSVLGGDPIAPPPEMGAGNFGYLQEDNINDNVDGLLNPIAGNHAGHNVSTTSHGIGIDLDHVLAPGGSYPAAELSCTSCHDPHGNANFRLLRGSGSTDASGFSFTFPAPQADGISLSIGQETRNNHTAYRSDWSGWCANCHGFYHRAHNQRFSHPVDRALGSETRNAYNSYNGPTDPHGGDITDAYIPEVPFESQTMTTSSTLGPTAASRISCMTCHRAHATSAPKALRWDPNVEFLRDDGAESGSYPIPDPYAAYDQRALCVKCHYDEASTHGWGRPCLDCHRRSLQ